MKTRERFTPDERLDEEAAVWLCERDEGFSPERAQAFAAWRASSARHAEATARVERTLALLDELPVVRAGLESRVARVDVWPAQETVVVRPRFVFPVWAAGIAAALVLGFVAWWLTASRVPAFELYATDATVPRRVVLRDGSVVDLNAGSEIRVEFVGRERRVALGAGEAHFQVAPDKSRPFVVSAGGVAVRAVGTAFNVRLAAESVDVLVVEGKVEVAPRHSPPPAPAAPAPVPILAAGERVVVSRENPAAAPVVEKVAPASIRTLLAWQDRMTSFVDVPLREIVAQFNRRNTVQLVLEDPALGERKVGGAIALEQVEAFVRLLVQEGDIVAEPRAANEILLRRAR